MVFSIQKLSAYTRAEEHLVQKTAAGAVVSIIGITTAIILFFAEAKYFWETYKVHEMGVDQTTRELLHVNLNITFPSLPCHVLSLDALDMSGKHEVDITEHIVKERRGRDGRSMGLFKADPNKPKGGEGGVPQMIQIGNQVIIQNNVQESAKDVALIKDALTAGEGCTVAGALDVQRVAGNFHVSVHSQSYFVLQQVFHDTMKINVSHTVHQMSFGPNFPGAVNPLEDYEQMVPTGSGTFKYFLKVVPTQYSPLKGREMHTNQYSVTEYYTEGSSTDGQLPAVYFLYDLSPITVSITEKKRAVAHFLTRICAVVGGVFAVTGMLDKWVHGIVHSLSGKK